MRAISKTLLYIGIGACSKNRFEIVLPTNSVGRILTGIDCNLSGSWLGLLLFSGALRKELRQHTRASSSSATGGGLCKASRVAGALRKCNALAPARGNNRAVPRMKPPA